MSHEPTRKRKGTGKVTLADVAKYAGVGSMTVSRALRTPDAVSEKLREKIEEAVRTLGYIPNKAAGALASGQSDTVIALLPSGMEFIAAAFLPSFQRYLNKAGYQLILGYFDGEPGQEHTLLSALMAHHPAAVLLYGCQQSMQTHQLLSNAQVPVLKLGEYNVDTRYPTIGVDHFAIGKGATTHLIEHGYDQIGFIGAGSQLSMLQQQLQGWQSALLKHYYTPDHSHTTHERPSAEFGREGLAKLLLRQASLNALVCSHAEIALGVLFECQRRVLKVPEQMAIICLEDAPILAHTYPPIASAIIDYHAMGKSAAKLLCQHLNQQTEAMTSHEIHFSIKGRASSHARVF
ncbi:HTH-type transcriptional regulator GntR [Vibrio stylophorae]|uniref:HTH-type transcriptional regulator GntR n=1 Tax=Vibrio stylophorae TaxID=659351 RepID=A0ABN8DX74_9VIBR|nr:LacI family DNA-binding transcriptional regulator [Vibrio stylophorae]CAH0535743.1 HTH-type transcriptional regulator GntR [Vibrio stylophorae]